MNDLVNHVAEGILGYLLPALVAATILPVLAWLLVKSGRMRSAVYRHLVWFYCLVGIALLPPLMALCA